MEESDWSYFQKLREIFHSNLHEWTDKKLVNSQQNDTPIIYIESEYSYYRFTSTAQLKLLCYSPDQMFKTDQKVKQA